MGAFSGHRHYHNNTRGMKDHFGNVHVELVLDHVLDRVARGGNDRHQLESHRHILLVLFDDFKVNYAIF